MDDVNKLLEGSVDDLKNGLAGLSHDDLLKLKTAEAADKKRKGALDAIAAAVGAEGARRAGGTEQSAGELNTATGDAAEPGIAASLDHSGPADIAPAETIDTAGAPQQIVPDVDMSHPAVDSDPRVNTTDTMNRIDFNDPGRSGREVVEEALRANT